MNGGLLKMQKDQNLSRRRFLQRVGAGTVGVVSGIGSTDAGPGRVARDGKY